MAVATSSDSGRGALGRLRIAWSLLRLTFVSLPNLLTGMRLLAAAPVAWLLWHDEFATAFLVLLAAAISDGIDGHLARLANACTALGAALDPVADKALLGVVFLGCLDEGLLPMWLIVAMFGRDILLMLGGVCLYVWRRDLLRERRVEPLILGKLTTAAQMALGLLVLALLAGYSHVTAAAVDGAIGLVGGLTVISFAAYIWCYLGRRSVPA